MIKTLSNSLLNMFAKNLDLLSYSSARGLLHARTRRVSRPRAVRCCELLPCLLVPCCCCLLLSCWRAAELRAAAAAACCCPAELRAAAAALLSCMLLLPAAALLSCVLLSCCRAAVLFSSKNFQDFPSYRILRHMYDALNIHENKN